MSGLGPVAWVALLLFGISLSVATSDSDLRRAKRSAFEAGQAVGACRIWREALKHDAMAPLNPAARSLDQKCNATLANTEAWK